MARRQNPGSKDLQELIQRARAQGWEVEVGRSGHLVWRHVGCQKPNRCPMVVSSKTGGDKKQGRGTLNIVRDLVRTGCYSKDAVSA